MYYVPVKVIPGRLACTTLERARNFAQYIGSCVEDEDGNLLEDHCGF